MLIQHPAASLLPVYALIIDYHCTHMSGFRHNKALGQHFLKSKETALEIVQALQPWPKEAPVLEIGPGLGILSRHLLQQYSEVYFSEIDTRIIQFLQDELKVSETHILAGDFLRADIAGKFNTPLAIIGNFPYNISSQILFKVLDHKEQIPVVVGMFQREMADRVVATHGNKDYGIVSVLIQAYYHTSTVMQLPPEAFDPPPKVHSAVIKLMRKENAPDIAFNKLKMVVKTAFNQRRKTLSNAMSGVAGAKDALTALNFAGLRAEALSVEDFITLTQRIQ